MFSVAACAVARTCFIVAVFIAAAVFVVVVGACFFVFLKILPEIVPCFVIVEISDERLILLQFFEHTLEVIEVGLAAHSPVDLRRAAPLCELAETVLELAAVETAMLVDILQIFKRKQSAVV